MSLKRRRELIRKRQREKADVLFEPIALQRAYTTETDVIIQQTDKPERFQVGRDFLSSNRNFKAKLTENIFSAT